MLDSVWLAQRLKENFGVPIRAVILTDANGETVRIEPQFDDIPRTQAFHLDVLVGWKSIEAVFSPGAYAAALVSDMGKSSPQQRTIFRSFAESITNERGSVELSINGKAYDAFDESAWPVEWRMVNIRVRRAPIDIPKDDRGFANDLALVWSNRLFGLSTALMPLEHEVTGEAEGGFTRVEVNRYERSYINRAACIEIHGTKCKACGFDFGCYYGEIGIGFIEVHHKTSISEIPAGTVVNPRHDLVPVCSNCHSMMHRETPPISIERLQALILAARTKSGKPIEV